MIHQGISRDLNGFQSELTAGLMFTVGTAT